MKVKNLLLKIYLLIILSQRHPDIKKHAISAHCLTIQILGSKSFLLILYGFYVLFYYTRAFKERRVYYNRVNVSTYVRLYVHLNI